MPPASLRFSSAGTASAEWFLKSRLASDAPDMELGELIDPSTGEIDGQMALAVYPARFEGRKAVEILGLEDCSLRLKVSLR